MNLESLTLSHCHQGPNAEGTQPPRKLPFLGMGMETVIVPAIDLLLQSAKRGHILMVATRTIRTLRLHWLRNRLIPPVRKTVHSHDLKLAKNINSINFNETSLLVLAKEDNIE